MEKQTIRGIDIYNFPNDIGGMVYWMGEQYIDFIIETLEVGLKQQDPQTEIVAIKCQQEPKFETLVSESTQEIRSMEVTFPVQILVKDGSGAHWRLSGDNTYEATGLNTEAPEIISDFELKTAEEA